MVDGWRLLLSRVVVLPWMVLHLVQLATWRPRFDFNRVILRVFNAQWLAVRREVTCRLHVVLLQKLLHSVQHLLAPSEQAVLSDAGDGRQLLHSLRYEARDAVQHFLW